MAGKVKSTSLSPGKLLALFDEGCGSYSQPLLMKSYVQIQPPNLLPGETLILQQPKVTCVNTLSQAATGALHLTNYRIIFTGKYMQYNNFTSEVNADYLATLGYRFQKRQTLLSKYSPSLKKIVDKSRSLRNRKKESRKGIFHTALPRSISSENILHDKRHGKTLSIPNGDNVEQNEITDEEALISIPILSIYDIKKFPKQYLEAEKLVMLKPGIEILTTTYLSIKLCLGDDDGAYEADELIKLLMRHSKVKSSTSIFAYIYGRGVILPKNCNVLNNPDAPNMYQLHEEVKRLDLLSSSEWKLTDQLICNSYPAQIVVPRTCTEPGKLKIWSDFHSTGCFPVVTWRNKEQGNVLLRSGRSTSSRGCIDGRNIVDEEIISVICKANTNNLNPRGKTLIVFTDSSTTTSISPTDLSLAEGQAYFYPHCEFVNMDLPELSSTHQAALKLQHTLTKCDDSHYLSGVEDTGWLNEISVLLDYALCIVAALNNEYASVLLSVGSGLERVAQVSFKDTFSNVDIIIQLSSLVQLLIDPYYRTLDGFQEKGTSQDVDIKNQVLLQKEWICLQHPFIKRNLIDQSCEEDLSPLFLQFLDCVWQLCQQYPTTFEFSDQLLELLAAHSYSGRFGTFLDKVEMTKKSFHISLWSYINVLVMSQDNLNNFNYDKHQNTGVLQPNVTQVYLTVWSWFTRFKKEEQLFVASMFAMIETEKLQREYKEKGTSQDVDVKNQELLNRRCVLLQRLSATDEYSESSFNSLLVSSTSPVPSEESNVFGSDQNSLNSLGKNSTSNPSLNSLEYMNNNSSSLPLKHKWKSADDLLNYRDQLASQDAAMTTNIGHKTIGRSDFFKNDDQRSAISFIRDLRNSSLSEQQNNNEKYKGLHEYLASKGLSADQLIDIRLSKMTCSGYLVKEGGSYKNWLNRWFVADLQKKFVAYFKDPLATEPKGVFNYLSIRSVHEEYHKKRKFMFVIETYQRTYRIEAPSKEIMDIWIAILTVPLALLTY